MSISKDVGQISSINHNTGGSKEPAVGSDGDVDPQNIAFLQ